MTDERNHRGNGHTDGDPMPNEHSGEHSGEPGGDPDIDTAMTSDDERLVALASRIDQGHPIDWEAAERDARDDHERAIIAEMRLLADVARVGREQSHGADRLDADSILADGAASDNPVSSRLSPSHPDPNARDPHDVDSNRFGSTRLEPNSLDSHNLDSTGRDRNSLDSDSLLADIARIDHQVSLDAPVPSAPPATWQALTIQAPVGRGAFATVYRAQDNLGRLVALKLFSLPREHAAEWAGRLLHEGRLLARLRHENVVTIYGADQGEGYVGLWMEFVKGRTLEDELHTRVRFSADEAVQVGRVLCRALAAVHREGLLHRDVKAHNVMRDETGRIVLMDFGSGREVASVPVSANIDLAGTPLYLAPEVFGGQPASIASDIYSLGVLLFHLVSDRYPVEGTNRSEIQRAHLERRRLWLRDARPDLPEAFVRVVERALASDRAQRYQSAGELEDALGGISMQPSAASSGGAAPGVTAFAPPASTTPAQSRIDESVPLPTPTPPSTKPPTLLSRYRWQTLAASASILLALVLLFVVVAPMRSQPPPTSPSPHPESPRAGEAAATPTLTPTPAGSPGAATKTGTPGSLPSPSASLTLRNDPDLTPYAVQATFYKHDDEGAETTLSDGDRVAPGDKLGLRIQMSKPAYVYVANQDEEGDAFLLYPLHREVTGPLAAERVHRLPEDDNGRLWRVTSAGVREHFLVFVSPTILKDFDTLLRDLPRVDEGRPVTILRAPKNLIGRTRGVGGLAKADATPPSELLRLFKQAQPLSEQQETTDGKWIRKLTLVNPITRSRPGASSATPPASPSH
jgi:serine/threonine protein kinase